MTTPAPLRIERDGDVAVVVLENPPLNLFDGPAFDALEAVAAELVPLTDPARADRARAVLFEARGKVVSGGVDVTEFRDIAEGPEPAQRGAELWARLLKVAQTIEDLPVPTVFAAHGLTLTAAFELALACDILLAAEKASFGLVEIVVGLTRRWAGRSGWPSGPAPPAPGSWSSPASATRPPSWSGGTSSTGCCRTRASPRPPASTPPASRPAPRSRTRPPRR